MAISPPRSNLILNKPSVAVGKVPFPCHQALQLVSSVKIVKLKTFWIKVVGFIMDPVVARGFGHTAIRGMPADLGGIPEEFHHLVFAVKASLNKCAAKTPH